MAAPTGSPTLGSYNLFDTLLAAAMIAVAAFFLVFMQIRTGTGHLTSYALTGRIPDAAGLRIGTDVRLGGVKIGRITGLSVDSRAYQAIVDMDIRDDLALPQDSYLTLTSPVVGDIYLTVVPGHSGKSVQANGTLYFGSPRKSVVKSPPSS